MRIFYNHKLIKKRNLRKFKRKLESLILEFDAKLINYDQIYDFLEGWIAYSGKANTYRLRKMILSGIEQKFSAEISIKEITRYRKSLRPQPTPLIYSTKQQPL